MSTSLRATGEEVHRPPTALSQRKQQPARLNSPAHLTLHKVVVRTCLLDLGGVHEPTKNLEQNQASKHTMPASA